MHGGMSYMAETAIRFPKKIPPDQFEEILATSQEMQQIVDTAIGESHPRAFYRIEKE